VVVPKFYRPGRWSNAQILEEHSFSAELAAAEIPVVNPLALQAAPAPRRPVALTGDPATLAHSMGQRYSVSPRRSGRAPELEHRDTLEWIGRFIGRMHALGATRSCTHRGRLDIVTYGRGPRDYLLERNWVAPEVLPRWRSAVDTALGEVQRAFDSLPDLRSLRLHGDCHPGNILWSDAGPHFVDLDDALTGPAVQDLWMLISGDRVSMTRQLGAVLAGYEDFMDFDVRELSLIEPLRTLRMIHHSAWIARRWSDPAFPIAFPWFEGSAYWGQQTTQLNEQIEAMREAPLGAPDF
jgi:Ser/Thr protein kinase RdoA (MazF antagonist)